MKVELDLNSEQLQELDKDLCKLLKSLTKEQQTEIIKSYMTECLNNQMFERDSWNGNTLTNFGQEVISGLQNKISKAITDVILSDEQLIEKIEQRKLAVINELPETVTNAIGTYIVENLFNSKQAIANDVNVVLCKRLNEINSRRYN